MPDPGDPTHVAAALPAELARLVPGSSPRLAAAPVAITSATATWVWFVDVDGAGLPGRLRGPLVLRVFRDDAAATARREHEVAAFLGRFGYPAPASPLLGDASGPLGRPFVLQERAPGTDVLAAVARSPWTLAALVDGVATLQARLHALPVDRAPVPSPGTPVSERYLAEDLDRRRARVRTPDPDDGLGWLHRSAPRFADRESVLCHGDLHPRNVLVRSGPGPRRWSVIDWTDAVAGDPHHDVGRTTALYWMAGAGAATAGRRAALGAVRGPVARRHRRTYERASGRWLDDRRLAWWQAVHTYRGWLQVMELAEGVAAGPSGTTTGALPAGLAPRLLGRFRDLRSRLDG